MIDKSSNLKVSLRVDVENDMNEVPGTAAVAIPGSEYRVHSAFVQGVVGHKFKVHIDPTTFAAHGARGVRITIAIGHTASTDSTREHAQAWYVPMDGFAEWDNYKHLKKWNGRKRVMSTNVDFTFPGVYKKIAMPATKMFKWHPLFTAQAGSVIISVTRGRYSIKLPQRKTANTDPPEGYLKSHSRGTHVIRPEDFEPLPDKNGTPIVFEFVNTQDQLPPEPKPDVLQAPRKRKIPYTKNTNANAVEVIRDYSEDVLPLAKKPRRTALDVWGDKDFTPEMPLTPARENPTSTAYEATTPSSTNLQLATPKQTPQAAWLQQNAEQMIIARASTIPPSTRLSIGKPQILEMQLPPPASNMPQKAVVHTIPTSGRVGFTTQSGGRYEFNDMQEALEEYKLKKERLELHEFEMALRKAGGL